MEEFIRLVPSTLQGIVLGEPLPVELPETLLPETNRRALVAHVLWGLDREDISAALIAKIDEFPIVQVYVENVDKNPILPEEAKTLLREHLVFFLLTLLACGREDIAENLRVGGFTGGILGEFLYQLRLEFEDVYQDDKTRGAVYASMGKFYIFIGELVADREYTSFAGEVALLGRVPSYLTLTTTLRLYLLALLPQREAVGKYLARYHLKLPALPPPSLGTWKRVLNSLHRRGGPPVGRCLREFKEFLWEGRGMERGRERTGFPKKIKISYQFDEEELLRQLLTLQLPNWKRLWVGMRWPRTPEVCWRLYYFEGARRPILSPESLIALTFG